MVHHRFLPRLTKNALEEELEALNMKPPSGSPEGSTEAGLERALSCQVQDGILRIGNTEVAVHNPETKMKVPDVLFYENPQVQI